MNCSRLCSRHSLQIASWRTRADYRNGAKNDGSSCMPENPLRLAGDEECWLKKRRIQSVEKYLVAISAIIWSMTPTVFFNIGYCGRKKWNEMKFILRSVDMSHRVLLIIEDIIEKTIVFIFSLNAPFTSWSFCHMKISSRWLIRSRM